MKIIQLYRETRIEIHATNEELSKLLENTEIYIIDTFAMDSEDTHLLTVAQCDEKEFVAEIKNLFKKVKLTLNTP